MDRSKLHWAVERGQSDLVLDLLHKGANVTAKDSHGETPLHYAAKNGCLEILKALVDAGSSLISLDELYRTPLFCAQQHEGSTWKDCSDFLTSPKLRELRGAQIRRYQDLSKPKVSGWSSEEYWNRFPLHCAARTAQHELVKALLDDGAIVDQKDFQGKSPLHVAVDIGQGNTNLQVVKVLLNAGSNVALLDDKGLTPLEIAQRAKHSTSETMDFLALYTPIRLLHIEPAQDFSDVIYGQISTSYLIAEPVYEALSYTWGSEQKSHSIVCAGHSLPVTKNLYEALKRLRDREHRRTIWVDAICIDQENNREKVQYVRMMKDIYYHAERVLVWLGEECAGDGLAFKLMKQMSDAFVAHASPLNAFASVDTATQANLGLLLRRPWFERVWVILEIVNAARAMVVCGSQMIGWQVLVKCVRYINMNGLSSDLMRSCKATASLPGLLTVENIMQIAENQELAARNSDSYGLLDLLVWTRSLRATDPRDKAFALVGLVSPLRRLGLDSGLDYSDENTTEMVYTRLAIWSLTKEVDLRLLSCAGYRGQSSQLPSWVPDWTCTEGIPNSLANYGFCTAGITSKVQNLQLARYRRLGSDLSNPAILPTGVLTVSGYSFDVIKMVGISSREIRKAMAEAAAVENSQQVLPVYQERMAEWEAIAWTTSPYPTGEDSFDVLWRTLICNTITTHRSHPNERPGVEFAHAFKYWLRGLGHTRSLYEQPADLDESSLEAMKRHYVVSLTTNICNRALGATSRRYLGLFPQDSLPGDIVCIFDNSDVPFVLRPTFDGHYLLMGDCYIHGIMFGEALQEPGLLRREFQIR